MATSDQLLALLSHHIGKGNGIGVKEIATNLGVDQRQTRRLVDELRSDGHAVCAHPTTGYYIAANADELEHTCEFLRSRALHSLTLESRLRKIPLVDLLGQLHLPT